MAHQTIRARYANGVFTPLEPVEVEDGCEVQILLDDEGVAEDAGELARRSHILEVVDKIHRDFPPEQWGHHPPDFVQNKKHYLYGHPKEEA